MDSLQEKTEKELLVLKLDKAQCFEELNTLIIENGKKIMADYFKYYGELCYDIQIKERELLKFTKNIIDD